MDGRPPCPAWERERLAIERYRDAVVGVQPVQLFIIVAIRDQMGSLDFAQCSMHSNQTACAWCQSKHLHAAAVDHTKDVVGGFKLRSMIQVHCYRHSDAAQEGVYGVRAI